MTSDPKDLFRGRQFDVEHALNMYALSYVQMPAWGLYDRSAFESVKETAEKCHIYFVGHVPKVDFVGARQSGESLLQSLRVLGRDFELTWPMPEGGKLKTEETYFVELPDGRRSFPSVEATLLRLHMEQLPLNLNVKYVGQAFGSSGERNAVDRLLKHETLQKISLLGAPDGYRLELVLVEVEPNNRMIVQLNPFAEDMSRANRIASALDTLYGTSLGERISLYEAAMIRYFQPEYNKEFKNSFPSTNLKLLQSAYDKDMAAVIAEFCFDDIPFQLCSDAVPGQSYHIAKFNLHSKEERDFFFGMK